MATATVGYWRPHTSSVNFCEEDYLFSPYIAEFWNTLSSLVIAILPLIGLAYSNPTKEWRFALLYFAFSACGWGSVALHCTLKALPQSFDEVPMLWMNTGFLFALLETKTDPGRPRYRSLPFITFLFLLAQTFIYYSFRDWYAFFLVSYISMVIVVVLWTGSIGIKIEDKTAKNLWIFALVSYVLIGSMLWIVEMRNCEALLPYFNTFSGFTFHNLWHLGAAYGTYLTIQFLIALRILHLGKTPLVKFVFCCVPILCSTEGKKKKG